MNKLQKETGRALYKENCYILFSAVQKKDDINWFRANPTMSFLYDAGKVAAEWEPEFGPILIWRKCEPCAENAREHYFYDFVFHEPLAFSQLAVENHGLPQSFVRGNYDYIFSVLERWTENR